MYGFKGEIDKKYGRPEGQAIYKSCKRLFAALPLAACINRATLVLHGGLFRKATPAAPSRVRANGALHIFACPTLQTIHSVRGLLHTFLHSSALLCEGAAHVCTAAMTNPGD